MTESESNSRVSTGPVGQSALPKGWVLIAVVALVLVSLLKPEWLEALSKNAAENKPQPGQVATDESSPKPTPNRELHPDVTSSARSQSSDAVADRAPPPEPASGKEAGGEHTTPRKKVVTPPPKEFLKEISPGVLQSPAGLVYGKGSAQGHRLDHVMEHASDDPSKPVHGVFEGSRDEILALLDEAWEASQTRGPPDVKKEVQGRRTVFTVNLRRKVGHGGGQSGARKNHPPLTGVRLVLEGRNVITAFPLNP